MVTDVHILTHLYGKQVCQKFGRIRGKQDGPQQTGTDTQSVTLWPLAVCQAVGREGQVLEEA